MAVDLGTVAMWLALAPTRPVQPSRGPAELVAALNAELARTTARRPS